MQAHLLGGLEEKHIENENVHEYSNSGHGLDKNFRPIGSCVIEVHVGLPEARPLLRPRAHGLRKRRTSTISSEIVVFRVAIGEPLLNLPFEESPLLSRRRTQGAISFLDDCLRVGWPTNRGNTNVHFRPHSRRQKGTDGKTLSCKVCLIRVAQRQER